MKAEWHSFDFLQMEEGPANIQYVQTCNYAFSEHKKFFLLHEAFTCIFQDMTKDLEVPFVSSKRHDSQIPYEHHTAWLS